jgi:hypothetical protein
MSIVLDKDIEVVHELMITPEYLCTFSMGLVVLMKSLSEDLSTFY